MQVGVTFATWSPDGDRILSTADVGEAFIWESSQRRSADEDLPGGFPPGNNHRDLVAGWAAGLPADLDGIIHIFDVASGWRALAIPNLYRAVQCDFTITFRERMLKGGDGNAVVWDLETGTEICCMTRGEDGQTRLTRQMEGGCLVGGQ